MQTEKETANIWEYNIGNNTNIVNCVSSWKIEPSQTRQSDPFILTEAALISRFIA